MELTIDQFECVCFLCTLAIAVVYSLCVFLLTCLPSDRLREEAGVLGAVPSIVNLNLCRRAKEIEGAHYMLALWDPRRKPIDPKFG